jgi:hypothetical protein
MNDRPDDRSWEVKHRLLSKRSESTGFNIGFSVAWTLFALLMIAIAIAVSLHKGDPLRAEEGVLLLVFLAIGVVPLVVNLRRRRAGPSYGPTLLELFEDPIAPGGRLVGQAVTDLQAEPREGVVVRLDYLEVSGGDEGRSVSRLWSDEARVVAMTTREHGTSVVVPIALTLPEELPARWDERRDRAFWRLTLTAELPGKPFSDRLRVPVRVEDAPAGGPAVGAEAAEQDEPGEEDVDLYRRLKAHRLPPRDRPPSPGIELREMASTFELRLTPLYYRAEALVGVVATLLFGGGTVIMASIGACAWLMVPVFGFIAYKFARATLSLWRSETSVVVEGGAVTLRSGIPGRQREKTVPTGEVERIEVVPAVQEENVVRFNNPFSPGGTYQLLFHLTGERTVRLRAPFDDKEEAVQLSRRIAAAARIPLPEDA